MSATISTHFISFYRHASSRNWVKASCSCGWSAEGKPAEVYGKAAGHDLDIEPGERGTLANPSIDVDPNFNPNNNK